MRIALVRGKRVAYTPEQEALDDAIALRSYSLDEIRKQRRSRYINESDSLFIEWQYTSLTADETTWRAAVAQIKLDLPLG